MRGSFRSLAYIVIYDYVPNNIHKVGTCLARQDYGFVNGVSLYRVYQMDHSCWRFILLVKDHLYCLWVRSAIVTTLSINSTRYDFRPMIE